MKRKNNKTVDAKLYWNREIERNILRGNFRINRNVIVKVRQNIQTDERIKTILDVGCGVGFFIKDLLQYDYKAKGVDISESSIRWARNAYGNNFMEGDISSLKLKKESIDCIACIETLQYTEEPLEIIEKLKNAAKYKVIIVIPNGDVTKDANWIFEPKDLEDLGFAITLFSNNKRMLAI